MLSRPWMLLLVVVAVLPSLLPSCWYPMADAWLIPSRTSPSTTNSRRLQHDQQIFHPHGLGMLHPRMESEGHDTSLQSSASSSSVTETTFSSSSPCRRIIKIEKFARLPVWPVWSGVMIWAISNIFGYEVGAKIENAIGGRVCPNFFGQQGQGDDGRTGSASVVVDTSPFIMLVHHCHSFWKFDPIRFVQKQFILAEGFPAHPHRGFTTVTYFLKGGFVHRDSVGVKQLYGATNDEDGNKSSRPHTQWLFTGAGLLHEEMFDIDDNNANNFFTSNQELYQLWLNVPAKDKLDPPTSYLLGNDDVENRSYDHVTPHVTVNDGGATETVVISGSYQGHTSDAPVSSPDDVCIFHVKCSPGSTWKYTLPTSIGEAYTCIIYVRQGSMTTDDGTEIPVHHTAYFDPSDDTSSSLLLHAHSEDGVDFMLLAGKPLNEPMSAQGSMVMNTPNEINAAYQDYQLGKMGQPWDHKLSTDEWKQHVQKYPCAYQYQDEPDNTSSSV